MNAAVFIAVLFAIFVPFAFAGTQSRLAEQKARTRRLAANRMNARLLRFDL